MLAPRRDETPLQYWMSFWPTAPLFGVPWRFEALSPTPFFRPTEILAKMAEASADEAARTIEESAETAARLVEEAARAVTAAVEPEADHAEPAPEVAAADASDTAAEPAPEAAAADAPESGPAPLRPETLYAAPPAEVDDLKRIKGVGPKLEAMLNGMGVYRLDQIAGFSPENLAWIDANLTAFRGRPLRDDWVAQARALL